MRKRTLGIAAVGLAAALMLAGCAGTEQGTADVTGEPEFSGKLTILTKFGAETLSPYFKNLAEEYQKQHGDVEIELIQETDFAIKDKTKTLTASGALPDIYFTWTGTWAENFVTGGVAADLSEVIAPGTEWGDTFGTASLDAFKYDGKYYGIPLYNNGKFMGYSKSAFEKAGVEVPTTFEEMIASCAPLREAGYEPIGFGNKDGWPVLHYFGQLFAYNVPSETLHADFVPETATWSDPGYVKSLGEVKTLLDTCTDSGAGSNGVLPNTALENFSAGRAAMYYQEILEFDQATGEGSNVPMDDFGIFPLPVPEGAAGDPNAIEGSPEGYLINAKSPQAALAIDFMKFATGLENAKMLSAAPFGQPSAVVGAVTEETSTRAVFEGIQKVNEASQLIVWLDTVTVPEVADAWYAAGEALVSGSSTPDDVIKSIQQANDSVK